jgi:prevent-host-death family protein
MCYMNRVVQSDQVGVRELRQNLSVYLERIKAGEALTVTDRGHPVAMLVPLPVATSALQRLIASGRAAPPKQDLSALGPPPGRPSTRASRLLQAMRDEERR